MWYPWTGLFLGESLSSVAAEDIVVCRFRPYCEAVLSLRGVQTVHWLVASRGGMGIGDTSPGAPPALLLYSDVSLTSWGTNLQDLTAAGV